MDLPCKTLENVAATTYIFVLQLSVLLLCTKHLASVPMLPEAIRIYHDRHPKDNYYIQTAVPSSLNSRFHANQLDIVLGIRSAFEKRNDDGFFVLAEGQVSAFIPTVNPLSERQKIHMSDLNGETLFEAHPADLPPYGVKVSNFTKSHCPESNHHYINSTDEAIVLLRAGIGVAIGMQYTYPQSSKYKAVPIVDPDIQTSEQDYCVMWHKGNERVKEFAEILKSFQTS